MHHFNDRIEIYQNINTGNVLPICESLTPMDQNLLDFGIEDPDRLRLTLEDCFPPWDYEELSTTPTTGTTTETTGIRTPDTGGRFVTSQYVETFESHDPLEASSSSSMVWSNHQSVQPIFTSHNAQAPEDFQQIENFPFLEEGHLDFAVPNMATPIPYMDMAVVENTLHSFWSSAGTPQDIVEDATFLLSDCADPQDIFGHSRQDHSILPTQPISLSLKNQPFDLLSAPQGLVVNPLPQPLPHTLDSLGVPFADQPWNNSIPASYDINHRGSSSTALTQTRTHGSRFLEIRPTKRRNAEDLSSPNKAPKRPRKQKCKKGSVPAFHLHTFSTGKTRKEPRKKTNNPCLNCIWNHRGVRNHSFQ